MRKKISKIKLGVVFILLINVLGFAGFFYFNNFNQEKELELEVEEKIKIKRKIFWVKVADTSKERYQGLSEVSSLRENQGMLFVHPRKGIYNYTMRGMLFDLDFVFIDNNKIVGIEEEISKDFSGRVNKQIEYDKVLELNAGEVKNSGIEIGDYVEIES
ncbi:MAG: DUF192 domain-containing protein [Candidatus Moraniibacteriota bacterium]